MNLASMARAPRPLAAVTRPLVLAAVALLAVGCSTTPPSSTEVPGGTTPPGGATGGTPTIAPPPSLGPPPSPTDPGDAEPLSIDPALLAYLPESVAGTPVVEDPDEAAIALGNDSLDALATALDAAVAVDAGGGNLVYALVIQLKPGALNDTNFSQWRDRYDEGVCASSGGIVGNAQADIGGRETYITSCVGGILSYHVLLEEQNVLISAWSLGEDRFGEELLKNLRVPGQP